MFDVLIDSLLDSLKILPFLFLAFLLIEILEKKISKISIEKLAKSKRFGPLYGAALGIIPQCGVSAASANLYATRVISLGTLIAIFLATSDEAIIILLSNPGHFTDILWLILVKLMIGIIFGYIIDFILRKRQTGTEHISDLCVNCGCEGNIWIATLKHTVKIFLYVLIIAIAFNTLVFLIGEENIESFLLTGSFFQPFLTSFIGLMPNCAPSVLLTNLYISGVIGFGSILAGLLTNAGIGIAILFKVNKNIKENLAIVGILYAIGVFVGIIGNVFF